MFEKVTFPQGCQSNSGHIHCKTDDSIGKNLSLKSCSMHLANGHSFTVFVKFILNQCVKNAIGMNDVKIYSHLTFH